MRNKTGKIYLAVIFAIMYLPLIVMLVYSFNSSNSTSVFTGFSLKWYKEMLGDSAAMTALRNTLILAIVNTVVATVLGTAAAVGIYNLRGKWFKGALMTTTNIPMMNPDIVTGVSLMLLFAFVGRAIGAIESLNFATLLIAHITFSLPYVVLNVLPKLAQTDKHLAEAAQDLGSTPVHAFFNVTLPSIMPGIVSGALMAFTLSIDDFVISHYTAGSYETLPLLIYSMTKKRVTPEMYAVCSVIFISVLVLLIAMNLSELRSEKGKRAVIKTKTLKGTVIKVVAICVCCAVVAGGIVLISVNSGRNNIVGNLEGSYTRALAGTKLKVYNWGEYISDGTEGTLDVNAAFEELTGIKIEYTTFDDNETMYSTLASGATYYDIIIPSDYMVERLRNEGFLSKLDMSQLTNYKYIDEKYQNLYFDPNNEYSVPYNIGMVGVIYNSKLVEDTPTGWADLWNEKYSGNILMFNNPRDTFAAAQFRLGIDLNTTNKSDWDKAAELLIQQKPLVQSYVMDQVFNKMENNNAAFAPYYAGDYLSMAENNPDLAFYYPEEGTNIFCDSVCVPSNTQNYDAAMMYINFLMEPEVALANAEFICYASPNTAVVNNDNYSLKGNEVLYPTEYPKVQWYHNLDPEILAYYESLWVKVKNSN